MDLNEENYFSPEAEREYIDASQIKSYLSCPAKFKAELDGTWHPPDDNRALIVGSYMDALWGDDDMEKYEFLHYKDLYRKDGGKRADIQAADAAFRFASKNPLFTEMMSGDHQTIFTGELKPGIKFRGKLDSYFSRIKYGDDAKIVDLKYVKSLAPIYDPEKAEWIDPIRYWHWDIQLSLYQLLESINSGSGELLQCYIAAISKENIPTVAIIKLDQWLLDNARVEIEHAATEIAAIKDGTLEQPRRCEHCDYCKSTQEPKIITYEDYLTQLNL